MIFDMRNVVVVVVIGSLLIAGIIEVEVGSVIVVYPVDVRTGR